MHVTLTVIVVYSLKGVVNGSFNIDRLRHQTANPDALVETSGMSQQALTQLYQQTNAPQYTLSLIQWELMQALKEGEISDIIYTQLNEHLRFITGFSNTFAGGETDSSTDSSP
ncbi:unnamed protein product [Oppiella nova]|uniref:Uncharacterized protein n=1 Tax=Oppiella nova TaxID=334625 RepID=A0A7R9L9K9_9ACAR|nr:unnamed protein product [Oppiella nova]CAG2157862.1 unnamed protein product [Oppiella nova]